MFYRYSLHQPLDELLKKNLKERYVVNYIKGVKTEYNRTLIECGTTQEARELESKLNKDYIKTLPLNTIMVSVDQSAHNNLINLLLFNNTAYQEEEKKHQMEKESEEICLKKFAAGAAWVD